MRHLLMIPFMLLVACPERSHDAEAQAIVDDLTVLDDAAERTVRTSPNGTGLTNTEGYVELRRAGLHARVLALQGATLSPASSQALKKAYAQNVVTAQNVRDYVYNAVLKTDPALRARAKKLAATICEISETPTFSTECAMFRDPAPTD